MPTKPTSTELSSSKLFDFIRSTILQKHTASEVARRSSTPAPTVYRWTRDEYAPDQTAAFERVLAAYGYRLVVEKLPPPDPNPLQFEVRDASTPSPSLAPGAGE